MPKLIFRNISLSIVFTLLCLQVNASSLADEDQFDFLRSLYPQLALQSEESFEQCSEETKHYEKLAHLIHQSGQSAEIILIAGAKQILHKKILHWFGEVHEQHVFSQIHPILSKLKEGHPQNDYFHTFFARALENHTVLENLLLAGEYIFQTVQDLDGGTVLFLGRTPCLVQVAYEEVLKQEHAGHIQQPVHLNFSGHPDTLTKRESDFFRSKTNIKRDIVTPSKLSHYFSYLDTKDILNAKALFIVDIIGSGSSLNSFLRMIHAYYHARQMPTPELTFLNLTQDVNGSVDRSAFYSFEKTGVQSNRGILTLPKDTPRNMKFWKIPTINIPIFDKTLTDMLDQDMFQEFLIHGVQYPAQKWTCEFDQQRAQGGVYHSQLYVYLRPQFAKLIAQHKKQ